MRTLLPVLALFSAAVLGETRVRERLWAAALLALVVATVILGSILYVFSAKTRGIRGATRDAEPSGV